METLGEGKAMDGWEREGGRLSNWGGGWLATVDFADVRML